ENSSWSCTHGVERWRANCGCRIGFHPQWTQNWRAPLRHALDSLRGALDPPFERGGRAFFHDVWEAKDAYGPCLADRRPGTVEEFLKAHGKPGMSHENKIRALSLMEMQRNRLLMYTSCAWFFDEISGIETTAVLEYAARALQLAAAFEGGHLLERP